MMDSTSQNLPYCVRFVPLAGVMTFLFMSVLLYFFGPFRWPITNPGLFAAFLIGAMLAIMSGYVLGVTAPVRRGELIAWRQLFVIGAISSCVMIFPFAYIYTGKMPWDTHARFSSQDRSVRWI